VAPRAFLLRPAVGRGDSPPPLHRVRDAA